MSRWWIDEPLLVGTSNPSGEDLEQFRSEGFTLLVSLLSEDEQSPNYDPAAAEELGFERLNIPVKDFNPPSLDQLVSFVDLLDRVKSTDRVVVHCAGGSGRTGTFAVAYWIAKGMGPKEAVAHVRQVKPGAVETREQLNVLAEFARSRGSV